FNTISAILRGKWLLDQQWAGKHLPLVMQLIKGEAPDFGLKKETGEMPLGIHCAAGAVFSVGYYTRLSELPENTIAVINITGPQLKYGDECSYGMVDKAALINKVAASKNVLGIVMNIDSPGGQASGTSMLADTISR